MKNYKALVDYKFFEAHDITCEQAPLCPWQFFITHPELRGKLVWYPTTGSLVREEYQGEYAKLGKHADTEAVTEVLYKIVNEKQDE